MKEDLFIGLDLGGTQVKAGLGDGSDALAWQNETPSRVEEGRDAVLEALGDAAEDARRAAGSERGRLRGIGLASPGIIDHAGGRVISAPANLPDWVDVDVRGVLGERLGLAVTVDNDANAAAFAESRFGAGRDRRHVIVVTVGTGIGGGAIVEGQLVRGARGAGMELGHIPLVTDGLPCTCGRLGCLEAYAGGWAMRRDWHGALAQAGIVEWDGKPAEESTLRDLIQAAAGHDSLAVPIVDGAARALGRGLVSALHLLDSEVIILGGGIVDGLPEFIARVDEELRARALPKVLEGLSVETAEFGNGAGVLGAVALAKEAFG